MLSRLYRKVKTFRSDLQYYCIRGGENPEAALPYFWKIFDFYFEISNFMLDFPTPILT
jgi:hypothetical protein